MDEYISEHQKCVVEYRKTKGYVCERLSNGYYLCYKGRHKMIINGLGYDSYTGVL